MKPELRNRNWTAGRYDTIILQRIVPHYRAPLFRRLHERYGWHVVAAETPLNAGFSLAQPEPWLHTFPMDFPDPANEYKANIDVGAFLETFRPKQVIAEFSLSQNWCWAFAWRSLMGRPPKIVFWTHGFNFRRGFRHPRDIAAQVARLPLLATASSVLCYSQGGADWVQAWLPWKRVAVAPNTIDIEALPHRLAPRTSAKPGDGLRLLSIGRLTKDKRFPLLVRAFRRLLSEGHNASLTIVGDGPDRERVCAEAGDLIGRKIFLPGAVYDEESLSSYFLNAEVFVYAGAIGLAANQALAYGLPVVIFEDRLEGGPRHSPEACYVIDGLTGWRVKPATEDALFCAIKTALNEIRSPTSHHSSKARQFAEENLILERMVESFARIGQLDIYADQAFSSHAAKK